MRRGCRARGIPCECELEDSLEGPLVRPVAVFTKPLNSNPGARSERGGCFRFGGRLCEKGSLSSPWAESWTGERASKRIMVIAAGEVHLTR